jgi:methylmalonyl-CoA mutase cobalamin-binding subunit
MELKIKKEYLDYSIGGGKMKVVKLKNLPENKWKEYYDMGFKKFFTVVKKVEPVIETIVEENKDIENDTNK